MRARRNRCHRMKAREPAAYIPVDHHDDLADVIPADAPLKWNGHCWVWKMNDEANSIVFARTLEAIYAVLEGIRAQNAQNGPETHASHS